MMAIQLTLHAYVVDTWNKFMSALSLGYLAVATSTLSSTATEVKLHACDEWQAWFTAALSPSSKNMAVELMVSSGNQPFQACRAISSLVRLNVLVILWT
jgi:hypothetical protein